MAIPFTQRPKVVRMIVSTATSTTECWFETDQTPDQVYTHLYAGAVATYIPESCISNISNQYDERTVAIRFQLAEGLSAGILLFEKLRRAVDKS